MLLKTKEESAGYEAATTDMIANHIAGYPLRSVSVLSYTKVTHDQLWG
jgi:hypothetical protein